ncbi:hypothetical protein FOG48_03641 [Hanseniaspora uvarum]|nr:hypothetical protein FOG48_03641 [Hanseniaspora uvarum]
MLDLDKLDNLFNELDTINHSLKKEDDKTLEHNDDILHFENTVTKHDRFKEIEDNLKKLPKLNNTFDKLCYTEKDNKVDKNKSILGNYLEDKDTDKYFKRKYFEIQDSKTKYGKSKYRFKNKK